MVFSLRCVIALRQCLRRLAGRGAAILISSHVLAEIELLATHVVVMNAGAVVTAGRMEDLLGTGAYEFEVDDVAQAGKALRTVAGVRSVTAHGQRLLVAAPGCSVRELNHVLVSAGVGVGTMRATRSLEAAFLGLVGQDDAVR